MDKDASIYRKTKPSKEIGTFSGVMRVIENIGTYVLLGGYAASVVLGLLWAFIMSLRPASELFEYGAWALPKSGWKFDNYAAAWQGMRVGRYLLNSFIYSIVGTLGSLYFAATTAYILGRVKFRGRSMLYYLLLASLMVPGFLAMAPRYFLLGDLGLIDTYTVMFLLAWSGGLAFNVFLLVNFFETLPMEMEEAALIDGANAWNIFWKVMMPLTRPGLVTISIFSFLAQWNEFMTPLIYLRDPSKYPLSLGLAILSFSAQYGAQHTVLFAGILIFTVPILVFYFVLRDQITEGLTVGAVKG